MDLNKEEYRMFPHIEKKELTLEQAISKIELVTQENDFEETTFIHFNNVTQDDYKYLPMYFEEIGDIAVSHHLLEFHFSIFQENIYSNGKEMGLAKGDQLILLFENGEKLTLNFFLRG